MGIPLEVIEDVWFVSCFGRVPVRSGVPDAVGVALCAEVGCAEVGCAEVGCAEVGCAWAAVVTALRQGSG
ncbi:hypothetical protein ACFV94_36140 [Streptomyces sp. NPDC059896]|uniref:hypothetical protein n=1 Tax=Streptomyces sp. NPDC059896 TaxID=3346993 RepID=UPI003658839D